VRADALAESGHLPRRLWLYQASERV